MKHNIALKEELRRNAHPAVPKTVEDWRILPYHLASKTYTHNFETYLKDSNAYTNTYFARYFEWQGVCREAWFFKCVAEDLLQSLGVFITKTAHNDYVQETFPFQSIRGQVNSAVVKNASFYLIFRFFNAQTDELVSGGYQQIVFADHERRIARLPEEVIQKVREFEVPMI